MLNAIPIIGWVLSLLFSASLALPFWLIWTVNGVGALDRARRLLAQREK